MKRGWKHPMHVDTFDSLAAARRAYPHVTRFRRVVLGDLVRHPRTLDLYRAVVSLRVLQ